MKFPIYCFNLNCKIILDKEESYKASKVNLGLIFQTCFRLLTHDFLTWWRNIGRDGQKFSKRFDFLFGNLHLVFKYI